MADLMQETLSKVIPFTFGEYTTEGILRSVEEGNVIALALPEQNSAVFAEVVKYECKTRVRVIAFAGEFRDENIDRLEAFAKAIGADGVEIKGRRGWVRKLADFGYEEAYTTVVKDFK